MGAALVANRLEEQQRIGDPPARVGIHPDELLVPGRDLVGVPVPGQPALVETGYAMNEGDLEVEARFRNRTTHRIAELGDDRLFGFKDGVGR